MGRNPRSNGAQRNETRLLGRKAEDPRGQAIEGHGAELVRHTRVQHRLVGRAQLRLLSGRCNCGAGRALRSGDVNDGASREQEARRHNGSGAAGKIAAAQLRATRFA